MSTNKNGSKKGSTLPKKSTPSISENETSTDRIINKKKEDTQKKKTKEIASYNLSSKISEKNTKPQKSSTSIKTEKILASSSKVSSKTEKISLNNSKKTTSKPTTSSKTSNKIIQDIKKTSSESTPEVTNITSRSSLDHKKSTSLIRSSSKNNSSRRETPPTTSSSRVQKTQYFPSKNLYSNALKSSDMQEKLLQLEASTSKIAKEKSRTRKHDKVEIVKTSEAKKEHFVESSRSVRSKTMNVKESNLKNDVLCTSLESVKLVKNKIGNKVEKDISPDTSSLSERPRTATLRKGSIVNANIVGPDFHRPIEKPLVKENLSVKQKSPSPTNSDDNYEDDFESYESDFEAYSSSEDTTNLLKVSGEETSSVSTSSEDVSYKKNLFPTPSHTEVKQVSPVITDDEKILDSGHFELPEFKHKKILENIKESVKTENVILEANNLKDKINHCSLSDEGFEDQKSLQFINFAEARKKCEKRRVTEIRKKRGEDLMGMIKLDNVNFTLFDLPAVPYDVFISSYGQENRVQASVQTGGDDISEEVQTEPIEVQTQWTQNPIRFSSFNQNQENFWINYKMEYKGVGNDNLPQESIDKTDIIYEKRLASFLNQSVDLVIELLGEANIHNLDILNKNKRDIPFSDGYLEFNTSESIFNNTRVQNISIFSKSINKMLTVHVKEVEYESGDFIKSVVSVWDVSNFNAPRTILVSYGEVCCSTFSLDFAEYIFAGQQDGAILVWNIKEKCKMYDVLCRTPTFTTDIGSSHFAKVVAVQPIEDNQQHKGYFENSDNNEICSLDEDGDLIIWNLYTDPELNQSTSDVLLINTVTISLQEFYPEMSDLLCSDLIIIDKHVYVSTSYGFIFHCTINGSRGSIRKFVPTTIIDATCLEPCPFSPTFFLAGYLNGNITLYSRDTERPLMTLRNNDEIENIGVQIIEWSKTKPFVLYIKDSRNTVHIWDLSKSDMYPEYSVPFSDKISCLRLSPVINIEQQQTSYMLIGTEDGKVLLHLLNKEHGQESYEVYKDHVITFLNYASRL